MKSHMLNEEINILVEDNQYIEQKIKSDIIILNIFLKLF